MKMKNYLNEKFETTFQQSPSKYYSCGGRFEVLGNHTDHNHGLCIAATCDLAIYAAVKKRDDLIIRFLSEGFGYHEIDLSNLDKVDDEDGQPASLIRGIAHYIASDYKIGGFDVYFKSEIPNGAGISSSAAFELLVGHLFNALYNDGQIPMMVLCKAGQNAERNYYGKMCGLLDQIGVAYGGLVYIDFEDIVNPVVEPVKANLDGYQFVIIDTGSSHEGLSDLYESIPNDMYKVADYFSKAFLREATLDELKEHRLDIIENCGELAYQRAEHFFKENERVEKAFKAIKANKIEALIKLMNESRNSSEKLLQNMFIDKKKGSPLEACELVYKASRHKAGVKVNGGGFAGSVVALVPKDVLSDVIDAAKEKYGRANIYLVDVRNEEPSELE